MHSPPRRLWFRISFRTTMLVVVTALTAGYASSAELPKEITNSIGMRFKLIPAGEFLMGSSESPEEMAKVFGVKPDWFDAQRPQHKVRITKPFYLGVTEVTQEQFESVMGKNPSYFSESGMGADEVKGMDTSNFPVEKVSWEDAVEFCKKLSAKEGETYRLPTEAEWEYACRAGRSGRHCFGDNTALLGDHAWFLENSDRTQPVGKKRPNSWGLYDMHGNVWEWCRDWYDEDYYAKSPKDGPVGPSTGSERVFRGGSWHYVARYCLSSFRHGHTPTYRSVSLGFRVARNPSDGNGLAVGAAMGQELPKKQCEDDASESAAAKAQLFPDGVLPDSLLRWYSRLLAPMNERSLAEQIGQECGDFQTEAYRFIWIRPNDHPVAIRLVKNGDQYRLVAKEHEGGKGGGPGKLMLNKSRSLTREEWKQLMSWINECSFWTMPTTEKAYYTDENGGIMYWARSSDDAMWIVEGVRDDKYHIVTRRALSRLVDHRGVEKYRDMCLHILGLAGFNLDDEDIY